MDIENVRVDQREIEVVLESQTSALNKLQVPKDQQVLDEEQGECLEQENDEGAQTQVYEPNSQIDIPEQGIIVEVPDPLNEMVDYPNVLGVEQPLEQAQLPNPQISQIQNLEERLQAAIQELEAAEQTKSPIDIYNEERNKELERRANENKGCNTLLALINLIFLFVHIPLVLTLTNEFNQLLYDRYPAVAVYYVIAILEHFVDTVWFIYPFSLETNRKFCKVIWPFWIVCAGIDFWGATMIWSSKFQEMFSEQNLQEQEQFGKLNGLVQSIFWYRFIGSCLALIIAFCACCHYCTWKTGDSVQIRRDGKQKLEDLLIYQWPNTFKIPSRVYNDKSDANLTCAICLGNFCDTPNKELVQLKCNEAHVFHSHCISGWAVKQMKCPMCRAPFELWED